MQYNMRRWSLSLGLTLLVAAYSAPAARAQWTQLPLITAASKAAGNYGGEGCQVITNMASDSSGNVLVFGTDVGGLYRSVDGGGRWEPINVGYKPRGSAYVAVDPNNSQCFLSVGANGGNRPSWHGIWRSTNQGGNWSNVLAKDNDLDSGPGGRGWRQLVFDPSSVSGGKSRIVYWSTPNGIADADKGLWKSQDNGATWTRLSGSYAASYLALHPTKGYLYIGTTNGLFKSVDGGATFAQIQSGNILGLATSKAQPDWIYTVRSYDIERSTNAGQTWTRVAGGGLPTSAWNGGPGWFRIEASPANANALSISHDTGYWAQHPHFYSSDGGANWTSPSVDKTNAFIGGGTDSRTATTLFHPTNASILWDNAGDLIYKSTDGGAHFRWANNGYTGYTSASYVNFTVGNPDLYFTTSQDYESALTTDGGSTWKYLDIGNTNNNDGTPGWGGFQYSGYAFNTMRMFAGNADSWGGTRHLKVSTDGGVTWAATGLDSSGRDVSCGDPTNSNIGFYGNLRTTDQGATWSAMSGCEGVFTYNPSGTKELYGIAGATIVKSTNHGASWATVCTVGGNSWVNDVAYDHIRHRLYITSNLRHLVQYDVDTAVMTWINARLPLDNDGKRDASTVACDPVDPSVVYVGNHADLYATSVAVVRSTDAGATWTNLTKQAGNSGLDGGHEAFCIRVHPGTRFAYISGECYGIWKYAPPGGAVPFGPAAVSIASSGVSTVEAENYDKGGPDIAYHDGDIGNNGGAYRADQVDLYADGGAGNGYGVCLTNAGEWLGYTIAVASAGKYDITMRYTGVGGSAHLDFGPVGQIGGSGVTTVNGYNFSSTGGWSVYTTVTISKVSLAAGTQWVRLVEDYGGFNLDNISFKPSAP